MARGAPPHGAGRSDQAAGSFLAQVDLYELLEISPRASQGVIQAAYRTLVRNYHPDVNASPEAATRIRQLNAAYAVLSDPGDRAAYDLECRRARLREPVVHPGAAARSRPRRTLALQNESSQRVSDTRLPLLSGRALLGLILIAVVAAILLVLLWATDVLSDSASIYVTPVVEVTPH